MAEREPYLFQWMRFELGKITARDRNMLPAEALAEASYGLYPYRRGNLATMPDIRDWKTDFSSHGGWYVGTPLAVTGMHVWKPISGRDILVVAVYGNWTTLGYGTLLSFFFSDGDPTDHCEYSSGALAPIFLRGDAPVRFTEFPMLSSVTGKRSNHLVVCTPYDYVRIVEYYEAALGYGNTDPQTVLPFFAVDAIPHQRRLLLLLADRPFTIAYSANADDVETFNYIDIAEASGDPNLGIVGLFNNVYILKSKSVWSLDGATPETWRVVNVLTSRGSVVKGQSSSLLGIPGADEQGLHLVQGSQEASLRISDAIPEIAGSPYDNVAFFDKIWVESDDDFNPPNGQTPNTEVVNLGTTDNPIWVLTLIHPAGSKQDNQEVTTVQHSIAPTIEMFQTFKANGTGYSTNDRYWVTGLEIYARVTPPSADSDVYVELVRWEGADPANPDEEEVLWADMLTGIGAAGWYAVVFDDAVYLEFGDNVSKYMIRVTGVTNSTAWYYDAGDPYAEGQASTLATDDFAFRVNGFQYVPNGEWIGRDYICNDLTRWGAYIYKALLLEDFWTLRTELRYRYRSSPPYGSVYTAWFSLGTGPSGGALRNDFDPAIYYTIQMKALLKTVAQMPPFIDYLMVTFSRMIDSMRYSGVVEDNGAVYFTGVNPRKDSMIVRHPDEPYGLYEREQVEIGPMIAWRSKLWGGTYGSKGGKIVQIMRDTDSNLGSAIGFPFKPENAQLNTGYLGGEDARYKFPSLLRITWLQYGDKNELSPYINVEWSLLTDEGKQDFVIALQDIHTRRIYDGRYEYTAKLLLRAIGTKEAAVEAMITALRTDTLWKPAFEFKSAVIEALAEPEMVGTK